MSTGERIALQVLEEQDRHDRGEHGAKPALDLLRDHGHLIFPVPNNDEWIRRDVLANLGLNWELPPSLNGSGGSRSDPREGTTSEDEPVSTLTPFDAIVAKAIRWAYRDRIALGKTTALAGRPKIGKGLLYCDLAAQVTRGELEGDLTGPRDVILVTTEDDPGDTLKPRLMAAEADLSRVSFFQMGTKDDPVPFRVPQDADELGRRVAEKRAALVVIDPLVEFVDGKVDTHKSQPVRQALAAVNQIARENDCAVLVIFHLNKGASTDPLLRHEAAAAFTQVVRGGMLLGHDPEDPDGEDGPQRVLAVSSSNLAAIAPSLVYEISTARVVGDTGEEIVTAKIDCIGESSVGAHDLLRGRPDEEEQTGTDEAEQFLTTELANGARSADEMIKGARRLGISDKQLRRARCRLAVESVKAGFTEGWTWSLPKAPPSKAPLLPSNTGAPSTPSASRAENRPPEAPKAPPRSDGASSGSSAGQDVEIRAFEQRLEEVRRDGR
jgi:KaiC/GvpD/RAD55 family RecA-like ATPase